MYVTVFPKKEAQQISVIGYTSHLSFLIGHILCAKRKRLDGQHPLEYTFPNFSNSCEENSCGF